MKPSQQRGNGWGIMPLNSPGGSTLQLGMVQDLLCLTSLIGICLLNVSCRGCGLFFFLLLKWRCDVVK